MRRHRQLIWLAVLAVLNGGCRAGRENVGVQGEVTFEGRAIEAGEIDFLPVDGTMGSSAGATITKGHYEIPVKWGLAPDGVYSVRVVAYRKIGKSEPNRIERGGPPVEIAENFIPPMYNSQSTLKVRVSELPDKNKIDFHLGKPPA